MNTQLTNLDSPALQSTEQQLIQLVVILIKPENIFRLYHADIQASDQTFVQWLLVLPDTDQHAFKHYESIIELIQLQQEHLQLIVIKSADLSRYLREAHIYYTLCCIKQNLLWCSGQTALPALSAEDTKPYIKCIAERFNIAFEKAAWFLRQAYSLFEEFDNDALSCFAVQQAAELALRIFILCITGQEIKTHSITQLLNKCRYIAPGIAAIFPANTTEEKQGIQILEKAYLAGRYTETFTVEPETLHYLMTKTKLLHKHIRKTFNEYISLITDNTS